MKRILYVSDGYPCKRHPGYYRFVHNVVNGLRDRGVDVPVAVPGLFYESCIDTDQQIIRPVYYAWLKKKHAPSALLRLRDRSYYRAIEKVVQQTSPRLLFFHFLKTALPYLARRTNSLPVVVTAGESVFEPLNNVYGREEIARLLQRHVNLFISVSDSGRNYLETRYGIEAARIVTLPNAVDTVRFRPIDQAEARIRIGLDPKARIVIFVGHFNERKGARRVARALDRVQDDLPDIASIFIGNGKDIPDPPNLIMRGQVEHEDMPWYLSAADVFVLPTRNEGRCNAIAEAMACGLPLITSDIASVREQVSEEFAIIVDPDDVDRLSEAISRLMADDKREHRRAMGWKARKASLHYTLEQRIDDIYDQITRMLP